MQTPNLILVLNPAQLDEQTRRDLEANAQLRRQSPETLIAELLTKRLGGLFQVKPAAAA